MKILSQVTVLACLLLPAGVVQSAESPSFDLLKAMSAADFRATGLDHLSDTQLQALNAWIGGYERNQASARCAPAAATVTTARPASTQAANSGDVVAHLVGKFNGWAAGKRFTLDNGQVWEQIDDTLASHAPLSNPKVTITGGLFNAHYLSIDGVSDSVTVRQVNP